MAHKDKRHLMQPFHSQFATEQRHTLRRFWINCTITGWVIAQWAKSACSQLSRIFNVSFRWSWSHIAHRFTDTRTARFTPSLGVCPNRAQTCNNLLAALSVWKRCENVDWTGVSCIQQVQCSKPWKEAFHHWLQLSYLLLKVFVDFYEGNSLVWILKPALLHEILHRRKRKNTSVVCRNWQFVNSFKLPWITQMKWNQFYPERESC